MSLEIVPHSKLKAELLVFPAFSKKKKQNSTLETSSWPNSIKNQFLASQGDKRFKGESGSHFLFFMTDYKPVLFLGMGEKSKNNSEIIELLYSVLWFV